MEKKRYVNAWDSTLVFGPHRVENGKTVMLSLDDIIIFGLEILVSDGRLRLADTAPTMPVTQQPKTSPVIEVASCSLSESVDNFDIAAVNSGGSDNIVVPKAYNELTANQNKISDMLEKEVAGNNLEDIEDDSSSDIPVEGADVGNESLDDIDVSNKPVDLGSWIKPNTKSPIIGGQEISGQQMISNAVNKVEGIIDELNTKAAKIEKIQNAPTDIKAFLSQKFLKQKWAILKSNDKEWLLKLKEAAISNEMVKKLVEQRLVELEGSK